MGASDLTAGSVMNKSASLMNDTARTVYTYAAQIPYLQLALQELEEYFQLHNIPVVEDISAIINCPAGTTQIIYNGGVGVPTLPSDMVEPATVWESPEGQGSYTMMTPRQYLPLNGDPLNSFMYYSWQGQKLKVPTATADIDIKIDYIRQLFGTEVVDELSLINVINARTFLEYRTAALCAEFIERNPASADPLNGYAALAMDRAAGINIKGTQNISTRRRPFRAAYKRRGIR